uniref:Uncharacterized protein n=1 Tax=Oryza brachyantha TaxID=4533 RepID=J3NDC2_ORYBR
MAATTQDHPPAGADPAAVAYVRCVTELSACSVGRNTDRLPPPQLRRRPRGVAFPAAVTAALDDLKELFSEGSAPMAVYARYKARRERAEHEGRLHDAVSLRLSVVGRIRDLALESVAARRGLEEARYFVRRTLRLLRRDAAEGGRDDGGADAEAASGRVVSLVELLCHFQGREAALVAALEAVDAAEAAELSEKAALEDIPEVPRATEEEDQLMLEAAGRFSHDVDVLVKFT